MTYTVLARDARSGLIGAATASRSLAAGNAVLMVRPGVGAVASQAWTNRSLRGLLLEEIEAGSSASEAIARVPRWDDCSALRQVAVLPIDGAGAAFSGADTTPWSGHTVERDVVVAGNFLTGGDVLTAMIDALTASSPVDPDAPDAATGFAALLVRALAAGERQGGDARGRQSAAVVVASGGAHPDVRVDLRVDDHADPLTELRRLVEVRAGDLRDRVSARKE